MISFLIMTYFFFTCRIKFWKPPNLLQDHQRLHSLCFLWISAGTLYLECPMTWFVCLFCAQSILLISYSNTINKPSYWSWKTSWKHIKMTRKSCGIKLRPQVNAVNSFLIILKLFANHITRRAALQWLMTAYILSFDIYTTLSVPEGAQHTGELLCPILLMNSEGFLSIHILPCSMNPCVKLYLMLPLVFVLVCTLLCILKKQKPL